MKTRGVFVCLLLGFLSPSVAPLAVPSQGRVIYVNAVAPGGDTGASWLDAFRSLQSALAAAVEGDEIWVAQGTYLPTEGDDRSASFALVNGVRLFGGFAGTEADAASRNPWARPTILSGNVGAQDDETDDSFHVVTAGAAIGPRTVLDGFTIERGNADDDAPLGGGGIYVAGSPTITRCLLRDNRGEAGGAVYVELGSPVIVDCNFFGNVSATGGALYVRGGETTLVSVELVANRAERGAAALVESGRLKLVNATVALNAAGHPRSALWIDGGEVLVHNSIIWGNAPAGSPFGGFEPVVAFSDVEGGFNGPGNLDADPRFVDAAAGDFRLAPDSPAIDAGSNALVPPAVTTARGGRARIVAGRAPRDRAKAVVDLGAWEFDDRDPLQPGGDRDASTALVPLADLDGDGVPDETDCRPLDPDVWAVPSPARDLIAEGKSPTSLSWRAPAAPGGTGLLFDVLRSTSPSGFDSGLCIASDLVATFTTDAAPVTGAVYYLVRAKNPCGGSLGEDSGSNPRVGAACSGIGQPCSNDAACASGVCADGYCCDGRCPGACESCALPGLVGTCSAVPAGTDPADECLASPEATCGLTGQCSGARACELWPEGTVCTPPSCADASHLITPDTCSGAGACVDGGTEDCSPYACDPASAACRTTCASDDECAIPGCCANACVDEATDPANCGACGLTCTNAHGTTSCAGGLCQPACEGLWGSCDSDPANGCETPLTTNSNCGACGEPCSRPGASASCETGSCETLLCWSGHSDCDGNEVNGCEVDHRGPGSWETAEYVGSCAGDEYCGFICPYDNSWATFATRPGMSGTWFRATSLESSNCPADIVHEIFLDVPPGIDYDLCLYHWFSGEFRFIGCSAHTGAGIDETMQRVNLELPSVDQDTDYWVEVEFVSGHSCQPFTIYFRGPGGC